MQKRVKRIYDTNRRFVDKALHSILTRYAVSGSDVFKAMRYVMFPGGKRIRPVLCLEACRVCGGNMRQAVYAACAMEFIHNFSLVHDDLPSMDNDDLRRGRPTCHKKFNVATAVLAGDALLTIAFSVLGEVNNPRILRKLIAVISGATGVAGMVGGQGFDMKYMGRRKTAVQQAKINSLKTAALFRAASESGAVSADASAKQIRSMRVYGNFFGEAFQIRDDIHDDAYGSRQLPNKRKLLKKTIEKAKIALDVFGKQADNLRCIADSLKDC